VSLLQRYQKQGLPIQFEIPAGGMAIWLDTGKSIVTLKEQLMDKQVYLQTEVEFSIKNDLTDDDLPDNEYRFIRLGFAAMDETEVKQGLAIIMASLYG